MKNWSVVVVPGGLVEKSTKTDRARKVALDAVGIALLTEYRRLSRSSWNLRWRSPA